MAESWCRMCCLDFAIVTTCLCIQNGSGPEQGWTLGFGMLVWLCLHDTPVETVDV
jgi:hypothetical protein